MIDYRNTGYEVRGDIVSSQNRAWDSLSAPGTWWTAAQRIAIGEEVRASRHCSLCSDRKQALSPNAVQGLHDCAAALSGTTLSAAVLSAATVDAVHRIVTDPGRLTRTLIDAMIDEGLTDAHFVELLSVVCTVTAIDGFARTIGAEPAAFAAASSGEPSRARPDDAADDGYWVATVSFENGRKIGLYDEAAFMPNVGRGMSLVPDATRTARDLMLAHYMPYTSVISNYEPPGRPIDRMQTELVAARVSAKNECFY